MMGPLLFFKGGEVGSQCSELLVGITLGELMHDGCGFFAGLEVQQFLQHVVLVDTRQRLVASLGNTLDWRGGAQMSNVLQGRVIKFERVLSGSSSKAVVAIELRLERAADTLLTRTYEAEQPASDESIGTFVVAMEQALGKIYAQFLADIAQIR